MTNAELFKKTFGMYATELWSMPEEDFLQWLNTETVTEVSQWILCEERLPKTTGVYLCTVGDYEGPTEMTWECGVWLSRYGTDHTKDVTAWMPLPEPYMEERKNNEID